MRLLRKGLAANTSSWIYKLSDNQRSGKRSRCLRNLRFATCPGWEKEKGGDRVRCLTDIISHPSSSAPASRWVLFYIFTRGKSFCFLLLGYRYDLLSLTPFSFTCKVSNTYDRQKLSVTSAFPTAPGYVRVENECLPQSLCYLKASLDSNCNAREIVF